MKKEEECCCEDLPWYMSCQGISECLTWGEEGPVCWGPKWVTAADCDNNVDQAFEDIYHFMLIVDKDVRSGDVLMFENSSFHEVFLLSDKYKCLNEKLKY